MLQFPRAAQLVDVAWHPPLHVCDAAWNSAPSVCSGARPLPPSSPPLELGVNGQATTLEPFHCTTIPDSRDASCSVHLLDTGGHVYDLAWSRTDERELWLCIASAPHRGEQTQVEAPLHGGMLQLWRYASNETLSLAFTVECKDASPLKLEWCAPGNDASLGVLAAAYTDGRVRVYNLPRGKACQCYEFEPLLELCIPHTSVTSLTAAGDMLAAGCADGTIAVWDMAASTEKQPAPFACSYVHDTLVCALQFQLLPPLDVNAENHFEGQPTTLCSVGLDGSEIVTNVLDMDAPYRIAHSREPRYTVAWSPWGGAWVVDFGDNHFGIVSLRTHDAGQHHVLGFHHGRITTIATSPLHPFVATGSADGSVKLSNALATGKRKSTADGARVMHKLFRLALQDGAYTLSDTFYPEGVWPRTPSKATSTLYDQWDPSLAITATSWGMLQHASRLANGTALGLVRIETIVRT
ncbi:hypothetical protein MVES1_001961 [Malassezia vespertilionis]|nr:uncharacterized protein MVES1_001961 [Malassezia vespertilionis]WFD06607.1 hypothetical protein MVES1_001961 [Malassezia vespertilionis]